MVGSLKYRLLRLMLSTQFYGNIVSVKDKKNEVEAAKEELNGTQEGRGESVKAKTLLQKLKLKRIARRR
ncbi:hypothetical protein VNO77_26861 [Canavalia gladiata]|uniref:Uncharacterized protein n=1 Tax=Canavalia gladiata TaxID=3824 RepID=A0AAN9Q6N0_CANGL